MDWHECACLFASSISGSFCHLPRVNFHVQKSVQSVKATENISVAEYACFMSFENLSQYRLAFSVIALFCLNSSDIIDSIALSEIRSLTKTK